MILPTIRASFGREEALHLVELLGRNDEELRRSAAERLQEDGVDSLLDDPRILNALLTEQRVKAPPALVFYVLVRQALLEGGLDDRATADYVASMIMGFGNARRAYRISDNDAEEFFYLVDMVQEIGEADARRAFLLRVHLGDYSLWLSGLFPDYVDARVRRRGSPPIGYYERMGATGYQLAADSRQAQDLGLDELFREVSSHFTEVRTALNRVSERYLWPDAGDPVARLLREVSDRAPSQGEDRG